MEVDLTPSGSPDYIYATTLIQVLKLNYGESPFYGNYGIAARASLKQQIPPDYYVAQTQRQFAPFFANLMLAKLPDDAPDVTPRYRIVATLNDGTRLNQIVAT